MDLILLPDVERLLSSFARQQDEVTALVDQRVYTMLPASPTFPAVRLTRYGGSPVTDRPLWLDQALVQWDVWGGRKVRAHEIAQTLRAALAARLVGTHDDGVVTGVTFGELRWLPDDTVAADEGLARARYLFTSTVWAHPLPTVDTGS